MTEQTKEERVEIFLALCDETSVKTNTSLEKTKRRLLKGWVVVEPPAGPAFWEQPDQERLLQLDEKGEPIL